jgi:hypothetical protein
MAARLDYLGSATCVETYTLREPDGTSFTVQAVIYLSRQEEATP